MPCSRCTPKPAIATTNAATITIHRRRSKPPPETLISSTFQDTSDTDVGSSAAESSSQVGVALDHDGGLHRDFVEIAPFLLAGVLESHSHATVFACSMNWTRSLMLSRNGTGSVAVLLTGRRASGSEVLDAVEDLIECRRERSRVAANLREHDAAFARGQQPGRQAVGVGLAAGVAPAPHGLQALADRCFPLVESTGEVRSTLREGLGQFPDEGPERAAAFAVLLAIRVD